MSDIEIETIEAMGSAVEYEIEYSRSLRRFFDQKTFTVSYDVDVGDVPESVLAVPVLAQVCPVAWATGSTVHVDAVDRTFYESLRTVNDVLERMYPAFIDTGTLQAGDVVENEPESGQLDGQAQLFSGGVDSIASYVRHRAADPALIAIQGWVVGVDEGERWQRARGHVEEFAEDTDSATHGITADVSSFLDHTMLNVHYKHHTDGGWYSGVGHGLGLLGLCAPLAYSEGYGTIHVGSTHWDGFELESVTWEGRSSPWGSHPDIDDDVAWAGTRGHHDAFDLTRQDKLELLAEFIEETGREFVIRTCVYDGAGGNCNRCEKCVRTATGLLLAGVDPNEYGYSIDEEWFDFVVESFETDEWALDEHVQHYWEDIQAHLDGTRPDADADAAAYFQWLRENDFGENVASANQPRYIQLLRFGARHAPYELYEMLYPIYHRVRPDPLN